MGPRYWPDQFGLPGFSSAAKSSPGVGMLIESLRTAFASGSCDKSGASAARATDNTSKKAAVRDRRIRNIANVIPRLADCHWECRRRLAARVVAAPLSRGECSEASTATERRGYR